MLKSEENRADLEGVIRRHYTTSPDGQWIEHLLGVIDGLREARNAPGEPREPEQSLHIPPDIQTKQPNPIHEIGPSETYYLPMHEGRDSICLYCRTLLREHQDMLCPIRGCTLEGPPRRTP